jgi:DNA-binding MarR family transcriptional regulator
MLNDELDELRLSAWRAFITTHATLIDLIDREMTVAGRLPLHWYDVLIELLEAPEGKLRLHELAQKVVLSRSGLTRLVDRLEAAGLLQRQPDPTDRRGAFAVLTEAGRASLRQAWPIYAQGIALHFANYLSETEARTLADVFNHMLEATQITEGQDK